jgi:NADPH2:quinone reductase
VRAVQVVTLDGPRSVRLVDVPEPADDGGKVLVDVHVAGVAFPEVLQTRGEYQIKPELPFVPGAEVAGTVRSAPEGSGFAPGQRVVAFPGLGGYAEVVAADPSFVFALPDAVSFEQGAALPMNYLTMHFALTRRGALRSGETVLVHGAAGGLGTAGVQLAKAYGARVLAVVSTEEKGEAARAAGADEIVLADGFRDRVKELTGGRGVDLIADPVGGDRFTDSLRSLAREGRLLVLGFTGGEIPTVKVNRLLLNNIDVVGVGWGAWTLAHPGALQEQWAGLEELLTSGGLAAPDPEVYSLDEAGAAVASLENRTAKGKVVVRVRS